MAREQSSIRFHNRLKLAIACCLVAFAVITPEPWNNGVHAMPPLTAEMEVLREDQFTAASPDERPLNSTRFVDNGDSNSTQKSGVDGSTPRASVQDCPTGVAVAASVPDLMLTLNALADYKTGPTGEEVFVERKVEISWFGGTTFPTDEVALYSGNPMEDPDNAVQLVKYNVYDHEKNRRVVTDIQMPRSNFSAAHRTRDGRDWTESECLGNFYAAYLKGSDVVKVACLSTQPRWMEEGRAAFGSTMLRHLVVPGTHDSGAFAEYKGFASDNLVVKYTITQEETLLAQLVHGIRYFDLRIGYYEREDFPFWLNHDVWKLNPFDVSMREIVAFLEATNEVIILGFHRFPVGFDDEEADARHAELIDYVKSNLGPWMLPTEVGFDIKLEEILDRGKKVIVAYNDRHAEGDPLLWPGTGGSWANTNKVSVLKEYTENVLSEALQDPDKPWWSAGLQLTPTEADVIFDLLGGLRNAADMVNPHVLQWFNEDWADLVPAMSVLSADFYMGTGIIQFAVDVNWGRSGKC